MHHSEGHDSESPPPPSTLSEHITVEYDIESFSDFKFGTQNAHEKLAKGWKVISLVTVDKKLRIWILKKSEKTAFWYFDQGKRFIGDDSFRVVKTRKEFLQSYKLIFLELITEYICGNGNGLFISQDLEEYTLQELFKITPHLAQSAMPVTTSGEGSEYLELLSGIPSLSQDPIIQSSMLVFNVNKTVYQADRGLVINNFYICYPVFDKFKNLSHLVFSGGHEGTHSLVFDIGSFKFFYRPRVGPIDNLLKDFLIHLKRQKLQINSYLRQEQSKGVAVITRNQHIGHRLWNDLTGLHRISQNGLENRISCVIHFDMSNVGEIWMGAIDILNNKDIPVVLVGGGKKDLSSYVYENNLMPLRLADRFLPVDLIKKVKAHCLKRAERQIPAKEIGELRVVFGLRVENRTWVNQEDGLIELACHLAAKDYKLLTIIVDGHDRSMGNNIQSHGESSAKSDLIAMEKNVVNGIRNELIKRNIADKVVVIDAVDIDLNTTIAWICSSDFFVAPWGAGLAKYKWVANLDGLIFSSKAVVTKKGDLKIYEDPRIREGATSCSYLDTRFVADSTSDTLQIDCMPDALSKRGNYLVSLDGLLDAVDDFIEARQVRFGVKV